MLAHNRTLHHFIVAGQLGWEGNRYADDFLVDTFDDLISIKKIIFKNGMIGCVELESQIENEGRGYEQAIPGE